MYFTTNGKYKDDLKLPIKKNTKVGNIEISLDDGTKINEDLIIKDNIKKISFIKLFKKNINVFTSGI